MPTHADHVADVARGAVELVRLSKLYPFPDFVKQASPEHNFTPGALPAHIYADPVRQQFCCHTAASTWLSALFYQEKRAEFHPKDRVQIEKRLNHYVSYWRIKEAVDVLRALWGEQHKTAESELPDHMFAYVWADETGHKERHLPMRTRMEVKAAAEWLEEYRDRIPFRDRHTIAKKIIEKSASYGAGLGKQVEFIEKQAGRGVCDPPEVVAFIRSRASMTQNPELKKSFMKMAEFVATMPRKALLPASMVKLAETLDTLDRNLGVAKRYHEGFTRPEDVLFKSTFGKVASELHSRVATTSGKIYEKTAFTKLALEDVRALLGDEFADRVRSGFDVDPEKMAEEVATLPRPDAEMLDGLLSDNGVAPILVKAASARQGFTRAEQDALAQAYQTV